MSDDEDTREYNVVINLEEQYSIWFSDRELPAGWEVVIIPDDWSKSYDEKNPQEAKAKGNKQKCLAYIEEVWTDMRPLSLRKAMAENA